MILNFRVFLFFMAVLYNLLNVNQIYVTNFTINTLYTDFWSRLISLDFFTNNYYYFWTAFYFLYCLLLLVVIFFMTQTFMVFTNHYLFLLLLSTYILFLKLDYFYINTSFLEIKMSFENFNILLLNSTNKYHPGMLYLSFMALVILLLKKPSLVVTFYHSNWTRLRLGCLFSDYYFFLKKLLFFSFLSIFLGSWWASQEGSWGGWWNWDASEVLGLLIVLAYVLFSHTSYLVNSNYYFYKNIKLVTITIIIYYNFLQMNFTLISHNFGLNKNLFFNLLDIHSVLCIVLTVQCLLLFRYSIVNKNKINLVLHNFQLKYLTWFLFLIILLIIFITLKVLINDFLLFKVGVNVLNFFTSVTTVNLLFLLLLICLLWRMKFYQIFFLLSLEQSIIFYFFLKNKTTYMHFMVVVFLLINYSLAHLTFSNFFLIFDRISVLGSSSFLFSYAILLAPKLNYVVMSEVNLFGSSQLLNLDYFFSHTISNLYSFLSILKDDFITQYINFFTVYANFNVSVYGGNVYLIFFLYALLNLFLLVKGKKLSTVVY